MTYTVKTGRTFERELQRLAKKYASLKGEYAELIRELQVKPTQGTPLGNNLYKIRLAVASKGRGKSGGVRIITYLRTRQGVVYLLSIYDKMLMHLAKVLSSRPMVAEVCPMRSPEAFGRPPSASFSD